MDKADAEWIKKEFRHKTFPSVSYKRLLRIVNDLQAETETLQWTCYGLRRDVKTIRLEGEQMLMRLTEALDSHPEGHKGPCNCLECRLA